MNLEGTTIVVLEEQCLICGNDSAFEIVDGATCYREARCNRCGARLRNSDLAKVLSELTAGKVQALPDLIPRLKEITILEAQASGPINQVLKDLPGYVGFEYLDGVAAGSMVNGVLCNDLEQLTFADGTFDLVITQDVLEHVGYPEKACAEINRVLKANGHHIFTVPFHEGRPTVFRAGLPEVYHGDPLRKTGALVKSDWGWDIREFMAQYGMKTQWSVVHRFYPPEQITEIDRNYHEYLNSERIKYFRYNSVILIAQKVSN